MARFVSAVEKARREGARAAQRAHLTFETPMDRPIDIFHIIEEAGIWLMFQPMPRLFGAYKHENDCAGIILNSNHPPSLQRYTAADEYGHHMLHHSESIDEEEDIAGVSRARNTQEAAAQTFAADFLMPLQLVNQTLRVMHLPIQSPQLSPVDVYKLSLQLGASYSATVTQLVALRKIKETAAAYLRTRRPLSIKEELSGGHPEDARADIWMIEEKDAGRELTPRVDDEVHLLLDETPSSGYLWQVERMEPNSRPQDANESVVALQRHGFEVAEASDEFRYGESGIHRFVFKIQHPGSCELKVLKVRPWQADERPASAFEAIVHALERATGDADRGLSAHQTLLLSAA